MALSVKILVVGKYYYPAKGGIEESSRLLCENMATKYHTRILVFNHAPGNSFENIGNVEVDRRNINLTVSLQPISISFAIELLRGDWDIIYLHAPNVFASFFLLLRRVFVEQRSKLIVFHHMDIFGRPFLKTIALALYDRLVARSSGVIVTSLKNHLISHDIPKRTNVTEIPLGIDPSLYAIADDDRMEALNWRRSLAGEAPVVGFIGRHARYKGLRVLIRALARMPGVHAFIVGDGPEREPSELLAEKLGIADRLHFLGNVNAPQKRRVLAAIDVFAFPSTEITEAFGLAQLEAMMAGVPVVASNLPTGVTDVAVHGESALLVKPGDAGSLAGALKQVLENPDFAKDLAARAKRRAHERFSLDTMNRRNLALIEKVLNEEPKHAAGRTWWGGRKAKRSPASTPSIASNQ